MSIPIQDVLNKLSGVKKLGDGWTAKCPAHEDKRASLSVGYEADTILLCCHAGCEFSDIVDKLGFQQSDMFPPKEDTKPYEVDRYDYVDAEGEFLFRVTRMSDKNFPASYKENGAWVHRNIPAEKRVLYQLPQVKDAIESGRRIFLVEGEKDVHTLMVMGFAATTAPGGSNGWRDQYADSLTGAAEVLILPDNDQAGWHYAQSARQSLQKRGIPSRLVELPGLPPKGDVSDWIVNGGSRDKLEQLCREVQIPTKGIVPISDAMRWVAHHTIEPLAPGTPYPWPDVNYRTRGMRAGWLCYIAGYPGHGKTAAALEIAVGVAKREQNVLLVSCEMSAAEVAVRLAQRWGLDTGRFYDGRPNDSDRMALENATNYQPHEKISVVYTKHMAEIDECVAEFSPDLLIVDYLQLLDVGKYTRLEGTTRNSNALKDMARRRNIPVLCLSQLSRPEKGVKPAIPILQDLRDSGSIEQDADQVIMVYREIGEERQPQERGVFAIRKARMGELGMVTFTFDGAMQRFNVITNRFN